MPQNDRCWEQIVIESLSNELRKVNDLLDLKMEEAAECRLRLSMMKGILTQKSKKIQELQATVQQLRGGEKFEDELSDASLPIDDLVQYADDDSIESLTIDSLDLTKERSSRTVQIPPALVIFSKPDLKSTQGVNTPLPRDSRPVSKVPKAA